MSELTINKLIKIIIAGVVIVVVILGLYFAMTSYVIPFFKGLGFEGEDEDIFGEASICEGKTIVGGIEKYNFWNTGIRDYFEYKNEKTHIYFIEGGYIKTEKGIGNPILGRVNGYEIEIYDKYMIKKYFPAEKINGTLIGGNEICEP